MRDTLIFGPFRLDTASRQLWRGAEIIPLAPKSFDLLEYLAEHQGQLRTRDQLFSALWPDTIVDDHALSVQIREVRKALGDDAHQSTYIETRHRRGYCFRAPVMRSSQAVARANGSPQREQTSTGAEQVLPSATAPETRYAVSGDVNIAYQVIGDGPIDLVFVMGWISHLEYFWTEPRFARFLWRLASFSRVILFDKRGTGLSDRVPVDQLPTIEQRMEDLHAVMIAAGSKKAVICGISEGGCMSAMFAATYPEQTLALVMIGTYARRIYAPDYPWAPTPESRDKFLREIQDHWGGPVGIEERAPSLAADPNFRRWWATYLRMGASPGAAVALTRMNTEVDIRHVLPAVHVPTLVVHRTDDMLLKVDEGHYIASRIPGATFAELPGVDHLPFVGDQDAVLNCIEKFVNDLQHDLEHDRALATVLAVRFDETELRTRPLVENEIGKCMNRFQATAFNASGPEALAAFDGPARAVRAAKAVLGIAAREGFEASAGLHTGECTIVYGDGIQGGAVSVARRILDCAQSGEVLVSGTVRDLVAGSGLEFEAHGRLEAGTLGEWQLLRWKDRQKLLGASSAW